MWAEQPQERQAVSAETGTVLGRRAWCGRMRARRGGGVVPIYQMDTNRLVTPHIFSYFGNPGSRNFDLGMKNSKRNRRSVAISVADRRRRAVATLVLGQLRPIRIWIRETVCTLGDNCAGCPIEISANLPVSLPLPRPDWRGQGHEGLRAH